MMRNMERVKFYDLSEGYERNRIEFEYLMFE